MTSKWLFVWTFLPLIERLLNEYPHLKEFIYGPQYMDFKFTETYLEAKNEFNQYHSRQISRTEMNSNIEFDSYVHGVLDCLDFVLGDDDDDRLPLNTPWQKYVLYFQIFHQNNINFQLCYSITSRVYN